jgi:hypothetical protein
MAPGRAVPSNRPDWKQQVSMDSFPTKFASTVLATLLCPAGPAAAADCAKSRPETVVAELYLRNSGLMQAASQARLSAPLTSLLEAARAGPERIDLSRWSGVRPTVGERLIVTDTVIEGRRASSRVSFTAAERTASSPQRLFAQVQLVREADGCWRIDDIVRDGSSLQAQLAPRPPEVPASR